LLLETQPELEVVGEAANGFEALRLAASLAPDVMLLDLIMPNEMNGLDVLRRLDGACKVLALTSAIDDHMVTQALAAGADGYLLKASRAQDMLEAIRRVARGETALDPAVAHVLKQRFAQADPLAALTPREREVFGLLARGLSNADLAARLVVSEATVRTHVTSVLDKLSLRDRAQVMVFALKRGLVRPEDLP
jgi:DNA-binding NarL/FixJ family response regulator